MKLTVFDALFTGDASDFLGDGPDRRLSHIHLFNTDAQTILLMEDFGIIPDFSLFPETLADKIMDIFAKMDIDFSDTPVFSDMFFLSGEEYARASISRFFTYGLRKFLESKKDLCMVSRDSKILIFRRNVLLNDDGVRKLMDIAHNLHRLVLSKYGIRA